MESNPDLREGSYSHSLEEIAEGLLFEHFLLSGKILPWKDILLPLSKDEYIGGLLDFTGELNRYSIQRATRRDITSVEHCRTIVELVMGKMLEVDFRNGSLRKKYDTLKYVLKNIENQVYELSLYRNTRV